MKESKPSESYAKTEGARLAALQRVVLGHGNLGLSEIRLPKRHIQVFCNNEHDYEQHIQDYLNGNIYVGINPRKGKSGYAEDVSYLTCVVIDLDPFRPKDTASSDQQHSEALSVAEKLAGQYPGALVVDSGSGAHVYFPVNPVSLDDSNRAGILGRLRAFKDKVKAEYETDTIRVDHIYDLPRIIRVWGSFNEKSQRPCFPLSSYTGFRFDFNSLTPEAAPEREAEVQGPVVTGSVSERFEKLLKANPGLRAIIENGAKHHESRSEAAWALINKLIDASFSDEEILQVHNQTLPHKKGDKWTMDDIHRARRKRVDVKIKGLDDDYIKSLDDRKMGYTTGVPSLDSAINGWNRGRLIVIAAEPGCGKTTLCVQSGYHIAKTQNKPVLMFPTESSRAAVYDKIISQEANVNLRAFQLGTFTPDERKRISEACTEVAKVPFYVVEDFGLKVETVEENIKKLMPEVVIVDYLQGMPFPNGGDAQELGKAVIEFKRMGQEYKTCFVLVSQLNRGEGMKMGRLLGTSKLEQQGDDIIMMETISDKFTYPAIVNAYVNKAKYGEAGVHKLKFFKSHCKFEDFGHD